MQGSLISEETHFVLERCVIGSWLDIASRTRVSIGSRLRGEMLDLLQQGLERIRVRYLFHHLVEQVLDVGVNALGGEDCLDDFLRGLLAVVDRVAILARVEQLRCVQIGPARAAGCWR